MGIGSSVIFSTLKGKSEKEYQNGNEYFSVAVIGAAFLSVIAWTVIVLFDRELLLFFGAEENLLHLAETYMVPIKFVVSCFLFVQMLAAFLRNDKNPTLATIGVLSGGIFNVFGDYVFVFIFEMGIFGAGLATAIGSVISCVVMLTHFFSKRNSLHFVKPAKKFSKWKEILVTGFPTFFIDVAMGILTILFLTHFFSKRNSLHFVKPAKKFSKWKEILVTGFPTFFIDVAMGILTILFNRQIMKYLGTNALSVYGIIVNVSTFVQCCAYSVGQASQPIVSVNYGVKLGMRIKETLKYALYSVAFFSLFWTVLSLLVPNMFIRIFMTPTQEILKLGMRIKETLKYALYSVAFFSLFWTVLSLLVPNMFIRIFMTPTQEILRIAPAIISCYGLSFLFLPFNIFSTYYFQAILKSKVSFIISVTRGLILSGILIFILPLINVDYLWLTMPLTELFVAMFAVITMVRYTKHLPEKPECIDK